MSSRSTSPDPGEEDPGAQDRLALLERFLASQFSSESTSTSTSTDLAPPNAPDVTATETLETPEVVPFRLFSTQKGPTQVQIRERTPPPLVHRTDPRTRAVEDEDPAKVALREREIASACVSGDQVLAESHSLPAPHPPSYRLSVRRLARVPTAPATSTREPLQLPSLAYLDAVLPRDLALALAVPTVVVAASTEPNAGLVSRGPYTLGLSGTGIKRRIAPELEPGPERDRRIKLGVRAVLECERDSPAAWRRRERDVENKARDKRIKKKAKLVMLAKKHGDDLKKDDNRKKKKGRLSKERRERAKKRAAATTAIAKT